MLVEPLDFVSSKWIGILYKKASEIRLRKKEEIERISNDFGDPVDLAKNYIEPYCQQRNPADHDEDEEAVSDVRSPVFETINRFLNRNVTLSGGHNQLFVLADAGMGKTSLLVMIKMMHAASFWPKNYNCELLKLGPDTISDISKIPNAGRTVLLLDALDEDKNAWGQMESRVIEILDRTKNFRRVIISCRTQYFPESEEDPFFRMGRVAIGGFVCPMIFLSFFDDKQVNKYCMKVFPNSILNILLKRPHPKWKKIKDILYRMKSLRFRPLLLAHIEDIMEADNDEWTEYSIYNALIRIWINREIVKIRQISNSNIDYSSLIRACICLAEHMQSFKIRSANQDQIDFLILENDNIRHLSDFDFGGRSLLNRNSRGDYRFSHYSVQEFLVSLGLAEGLISGQKSIIVSESMLVFMRQEPIFSKYIRNLDISGIGGRENIGGIRVRDTFSDSGRDLIMIVMPPGTYVRDANFQEADGAKAAIDIKVEKPFAVHEESILHYAKTEGFFNTYIEKRDVISDIIKEIEINIPEKGTKTMEYLANRDKEAKYINYYLDEKAKNQFWDGDILDSRKLMKNMIAQLDKKLSSPDVNCIVEWLNKSTGLNYTVLEGVEEEYFYLYIKNAKYKIDFEDRYASIKKGQESRVRREIEFYNKNNASIEKEFKGDASKSNDQSTSIAISDKNIVSAESGEIIGKKRDSYRWWNFFKS